jgi:hypothetical protein
MIGVEDLVKVDCSRACGTGIQQVSPACAWRCWGWCPVEAALPLRAASRRDGRQGLGVYAWARELGRASMRMRARPNGLPWPGC